MMYRKAALYLILLLALAAPTLAQTAAPALIDTQVFLTYIPNVQFAPFYVGLAKGYFADAGFNVDLEYGDEPVGVDLIAAGQRMFGTISGEQVIAARANQRPVVSVYSWFQQYPVGVGAPDSTGIKTIADLKGRKVGIPGRFGASYTGLTALLHANDMTENDIDLQEIGFNAPDVLCVGGVDAAVVYVNNEPQQYDLQAGQGECGTATHLNVIPVSSAVSLVSNGIVTSEDMIAQHPDQVRAFVAAFDHALRDTIDNPAEAYLLSASFVENLPLDEAFKAALQSVAANQTEALLATPAPDRATASAQRQQVAADLAKQFDGTPLLQYRVLLATIDLWDADRLGSTTPEAWQATEDTLASLGFIKTPIDLGRAHTDQFLP